MYHLITFRFITSHSPHLAGPVLAIAVFWCESVPILTLVIIWEFTTNLWPHSVNTALGTTQPTGVSCNFSPTLASCHFSFSPCQLPHLMPLRRCSWEKLFWWTWEDCHNSIWVDFWSHSFYTPSLSSLEMIRLRSSREIKNKQKDNPRPNPGCAGLVGWIIMNLHLIHDWICNERSHQDFVCNIANQSSVRFELW